MIKRAAVVHRASIGSPSTQSAFERTSEVERRQVNMQRTVRPARASAAAVAIFYRSRHLRAPGYLFGAACYVERRKRCGAVACNCTVRCVGTLGKRRPQAVIARSL